MRPRVSFERTVLGTPPMTLSFAFVPRSRTLLGLFAALGAASPASAQGLTQTCTIPITPPPSAYVSYTRTGSGDFDGDANADAVYQLGDKIDVMIAPGLYEARMKDVASGADFDVVPRTGTDSILTVSPTGLLESWLAGSGSTTPVWISGARGGAAWQGATMVRAWSRSDSHTRIFGLAADGTTVLTLTRQENLPGPGTMWTPGPALNIGTGGAVIDLVPFDRDGDGDPEIAVLRLATLVVHDPWSSPQSVVYSYVGLPAWDNTTIIRLVQHGTPREWLGWLVTKNTDGITQKFLTLGSEGVRNFQTLGVGLGAHTLGQGDINADGSGDLVASMTSSYGLIAFHNLGNETVGPIFEATQPVLIPPPVSGGALLNRARPLIMDIDNDGDGDCGLPIHSMAYLWFHRSPTNDHITGQPFLVVDDASGTDVGIKVDSAYNRLSFTVQYPQPSASETNLWLSVSLWSQDGTGPNDQIEPQAFFHKRIPISSTSANPLVYDATLYPTLLVPGDPASVTHPPTGGDTAPCFDRVVYLVAQVVQATSATAPPTRAQPGNLYAFHAQDYAKPYTHVRGAAAPDSNEAFVQALIDMGGGASFQVGYLPSGVGTGDDVGLGGQVPCMVAGEGSPPTQ